MEAHRFGNRLRAYRKLKGYTQQGFADQLGVSISVLGSIERGMKDPSDKILNRIAEVLNVEVSELLGES
jgi:transcriptional regulator with XRE-family HTH domain